MGVLRAVLAVFVALWLLPLAVSAVRYRLDGGGADWSVADRSSAGLLEPAQAGAVVRVFAAQTVRWRGIFAVHCWIVFKRAADPGYTRYDYTAWGSPIRMNGFEPDGRWFGHVPSIVLAADGAAAEALIPRMDAAIRDYAFRNQGDYRAWPGPNSNTFVQAVLDAVPDLPVALPPTAIGKDFPYDGRWARRVPTGLRLTLGGYLTLTVGWVQGLELSILGAVVGVDVRRPAIKLPGLGRLGMAAG